MPPCVLDASLVYNVNGEYTRYKGGVSCPGDSDEPFSIQWELINDSMLNTINNGIITKKEILILNNESLFLQSLSPANDTVAYLYLKY